MTPSAYRRAPAAGQQKAPDPAGSGAQEAGDRLAADPDLSAHPALRGALARLFDAAGGTAVN